MENEYAIVLYLSLCFIHISQFLRGYEDWYIDYVNNISLLEMLFDVILDINMKVVKNALNKVGTDVDIVNISDDLGTQRGLQVSPEFFRRLIKPRFKKYFDLVHEFSPNLKLLFHSCDSIEPILSDFN